MVRVRSALPIAALLLTTTTCVGSAGPTASTLPASPTAPGSPAVTTVAITSAALTPSSVQLTAVAHLNDGATRDVTTSAQWDSTNTNIAVVSASGLVTGLAAGDVDIHATYQSVVASAHVHLAAPDGPSTFVLSGIVHEVIPNPRALGNARIAITSGPDDGTIISSDSSGAFRFTHLSRGVISVEASTDGYLVWKISNWVLDRDRDLEIAMFPVPPTNDTGVTATARCLDGSWSWETHRTLACAETGIAYTVCPGPLC